MKKPAELLIPSKPKADSTGRGRVNPVRSMGESESRLTSMLGAGTIKPEQLMQMLVPRGTVTDIDSNIFNGELRNANKALTSGNLSDTEFFNRKQLLGGYAPFTERTVSEDEITSAALAKKERRKQTHVERQIEARMAQGMSREEAERAVAYNRAEGRRLAAMAPGVEEHLKQVDAFLHANPADTLDINAVELKRFNNQRLTPEEHAFYIEQVMLKQAELFPEAEGYDQFKDPMRQQKGRVAFLEIQIAGLLVNKNPGWAATIVDFRKHQAELMREIEGAEPLPPPPVLDFSTADLEQPERFIIKDLEGFKFDPDTHFDGLRLPYESCLFVLGEEPLRAVVLATQEDEDVISLKLLSEQKAELPWHSIATLYVRLNGIKARLKWANTQRALDKRLGMVSSVLAFLAGEQIGDVEVTTVITAPEGREIPPPKPGFCYNVVNIVHEKRKAQRRDWQGGTHASPREHKRKGHWWPSPKGGYLWRGPVIVNKGVLGRVDKEYHVTKLNEETP